MFSISEDFSGSQYYHIKYFDADLAQKKCILGLRLYYFLVIYWLSDSINFIVISDSHYH